MPIDEAHTKELRTLIAASRQQPVNFGLCLGAKPETDTLLLHRTKATRALSMEAKAQAKGTKAAFGTATAEGTTLSLACEEKPPSGIAKRARLMLKAMKLPLKVRLVGADGEVFEEDGEEEALGPGGAEAAAAAAPPPSPPPPPQVPPDAAALKARLTTLVQSMPKVLEAHPVLKDGLLRLAKDAQLMLGTNNFKTASARIEEFAAELAAAAKMPGAGTEAAAHAGTTGAVAYAKSRLAWIATRKKVEADVEKLRAALMDAYKDEDIVPELDKRFRDVTSPIMLQLDESLADTLDEATNATDPAQRAQKVADARAIIGRYQAFLAGDKVIAQLDENPLVPVAIAATLNATLTSLSGAIR